MSGPRFQPLRPDMLSELPEPCRSCLFWEVTDAPRGADPSEPEAAAKAKEAWWQAQALEEPIVSRRAVVDDRLAGYALAGDVSTLPRARRLGPTVSEDALLLAVLWVDPALRGGGIGRALAQQVLREAAQMGRQAVEAYGRTGTDARCLLNVAELEALGFVVARPHVRFPLLRLDLRQTARWTETVGQAIGGVIDSLRWRERAARPVAEGVVES